MAWSELELFGLPRADLDATSSRLFELGAAGLQEEHLPGEAPPPRQPWDTGPRPPPSERLILRAWFEDADTASIEDALASVRAERRWHPVEDVDWETRWRVGFEPVRISDRLTVAPPWDAPPGALIIEPGQGFGSGSHPTTRQALAAVDALADEVSTLLDVGCGSGILALAGAMLGLRASGVDVEDTAVADTLANARRNGLSVEASTTPVHRLQTPADLVVANLHAELVVRLHRELVRLTGRWLVVAGILADREAQVREALDPRLSLVHREQDGEWVCLRYEAPADGRRTA